MMSRSSFSAHGKQHTLDIIARAVAPQLKRKLFQNFRLKPRKQPSTISSSVMSESICRNRREQLRANLQRIQQFFRTIRHRLNQDAARGNNLFANQRTQRAKARRLLGFQIVHAKSSGNLAGYQRNAPHIRLAETERAHDRQLTILAQRAADIQLAVGLERKLNLRMLDWSP